MDVCTGMINKKEEMAMALFSDEDKFIKLAWLYKNSDGSFSPLQLQKFLFFYEMFSKVKGNNYNISSLRAYSNGPVFSNVYGDYLYERSNLLDKIKQINDFSSLCKNTAKICLLVIESMTENELSELTHNFDLWSIHEEEIKAGRRNITISESDISDEDLKQMEILLNYYSNLEDLGYKSIKIGDKVFMISKENAEDIRREHSETLDLLSTKDNLINPIFIDVETLNGKEVLLVD